MEAAVTISIISAAIAATSALAAAYSARTTKRSFERQERADHTNAIRSEFVTEPSDPGSFLVVQTGPGTAHRVKFDTLVFSTSAPDGPPEEWLPGHAERFADNRDLSNGHKVPMVSWVDADGNEHRQPVLIPSE
ncbi:hypothetical protein [Gordonia sp. OPL2]|uniref:hypothetical protein n=1 Tax=Gordonia sp. OPL2 TaxID=2486274 RepID=UPI0016566054|nr:hypothetical protein [Gordonia sp. OPL2]